MSRFSYYDTDAERLPDGMTRVGYDADTQVYTYRDADGNDWEGTQGARFGRLTRVSGGPGPGPTPESETSSISAIGIDHEPEPYHPSRWEERRKSWRQVHLPLVNMCVLIGLFLRRHLVPVPLKPTTGRVVQLRRPRRNVRDFRGEYVLGDYKCV